MAQATAPVFDSTRQHRRGQSKLQCQMRHGVGMDLVDRWEAPEVLSRFEQHRQHQAPRLATCAPANEGEVRLGQRISSTELLMGQPRSQTWVGGAVNGCHGVSGKGFAVGAR